ncbi:hypothetical protein [Novosphingopyxis iocasae]|uniref:hypothetical protein n=1 Tax=Novosphingopyxis iocasae TaxID=2762729 RepID=UPI0016518B12|nr:hypothetical protein [Novosphingopyxis iocasae]|tara:strand:+ start:168 stop:473 length:306 start_codon:yes stop_codon:yes gene_type:complete
MRKIIISGLIATAALGLSACSQETQDKTGEAMDSMGNDVEANADAAGNAVEAGVNEAGDQLDQAGNAVENSADHAAAETDQAAHEAEADVQNESTAEAKAD